MQDARCFALSPREMRDENAMPHPPRRSDVHSPPSGSAFLGQQDFLNPPSQVLQWARPRRHVCSLNAYCFPSVSREQLQNRNFRRRARRRVHESLARLGAQTGRNKQETGICKQLAKSIRQRFWLEPGGVACGLQKRLQGPTRRRLSPDDDHLGSGGSHAG
jgi:hypothetical protein